MQFSPNWGGNDLGDITTWAEAINNLSISGGESSDNIVINNVYISDITTYLSAPVINPLTIFLCLEYPLELKSTLYVEYIDGEYDKKKLYVDLDKGVSEYTIEDLYAHSFNGVCVTIISQKDGLVYPRTQQVFKYHYI